MGSSIQINDTLRISKEQGFPKGLDIEKHLQDPYSLEEFQGKVFEFSGKPKIRVYKIPPVRNFLVEDVGGKWVYWGLCHVLEITHDYVKGETSGLFKIIYLNSPEDVKNAQKLIDGRDEVSYFA